MQNTKRLLDLLFSFLQPAEGWLPAVSQAPFPFHHFCELLIRSELRDYSFPAVACSVAEILCTHLKLRTQL